LLDAVIIIATMPLLPPFALLLRHAAAITPLFSLSLLHAASADAYAITPHMLMALCCR
jgi:hypothetical protein